MSRVTVIGVGNELMGDDGFGIRVTELLRDTLEGATVVSGHLAGMGLMPHVLGADTVLFVDAMAVDDEPGTIYRLDPDAAGITGLRSNTTHGIGIPYLITNARLQGHSPQFVVYAAQIGDVMLGPGILTPAVEDAARKVAELITEEVAALQAEG